MKLGSLFDGSGGFPIAGSLCGVEPVWAAEVEPYPIAVTRSRFPNMKHLGDVTKVNGAGIEPVDIITFGSPCQDLSVAGKRAGLKHESNGDDETTRSGLFMEAIRIIKEMRGATNGVYPRFAVWENVFGAFSSNGGEDFRIVLEEFTKIVEPSASMPAPEKGRWAYADCYVGDGWSVAYRTFDAQYWGVPQRRRRIYLVADFGGGCAAKILFEREGVHGYFETGRTPWKGAAADAESCAGICDCTGNMMAFHLLQEPVCVTGVDCFNQAETGDKSMTVCSGNDYTHIPCVAIYSKGTRPHNKEEAQRWEESVIANCLNVYDMGETHANEIVVMDTQHCIHEQPIVFDKDVYKSGINAAGEHYIAEWGPSPTLRTSVHPGVSVQYIVRRLTPTECARLQGFPDAWGVPDHKDDFSDEEYEFWLNVRNTYAEINGKAVRQYTRQQILAWYNKLHTDSAEYKMWGNGIALPCALYVMQGIQDVLNGG